MKILLAFTTNDHHNPFVNELKGALEIAGCDVIWSLEKFWKMEGNFDVVHIQWPEYLFNPGPLTEEKINSLKTILDFWKKHSCLILTRHNEHPNFTDHPELYINLYRLVYRYCDGIAHLGSYGLDEFTSANITDLNGNRIQHKIIPHHIYINSYPNNITKSDARKKLKIRNNYFVVLIFGSIRFKEEREFLLELLRNTSHKKTIYLIPSWLPAFKGQGLKSKLRSFYYTLKLTKLNFRKNIRASDQFIQDHDVQTYFNAADIILIPRIKGLNSGNVSLGFFYKKVVVGPNTGNISAELHESGNPVFEPGSIQSLQEAIEKGRELVSSNHGEKNYQYAIKYRHPMVIGKEYYQLYESCIKNRSDRHTADTAMKL